MAFKDIEAKRKYHREYNKKLRKTNPVKAKPKRKDPNYVKNYMKENPKVFAKSSAKWRKLNPDKVRENDRKNVCKRYGITVDDYEMLLSSQNGVCAICFKPDSANRCLAIDHCHETGRIRGLLCGRCNKALGGFDDSIDLLNSAVKYLSHKSQ